MRKRLLIIGIAFTAAAGMMFGYGVSELRAAPEWCPGENYCYIARGCDACKNMMCLIHGSCPDPGTIGDNCYICARVE